MENPVYHSRLSISKWAEEDRPREKLLLKGQSSLSEAEILAILLGSGTITMSAVDLSRFILQQVDHDLNQLAKLSVADLCKFKGIGEAKAVKIISALELGKRRKAIQQPEKQKIHSSETVYNLMHSHLYDLSYEEFWVILLSRANTLIRKIRISSGGVSGTVADPKVIFKHALEQLASSLILIHNHPSGNTSPSSTDQTLTKKLFNAGKHLEIPVLDHLIYTNEGYFSFADEGML